MEDKLQFIDNIREEYKELHKILNINMSILLNPGDETTIEYDKATIIETLEELKQKANEIENSLLRGEDNENNK